MHTSSPQISHGQHHGMVDGLRSLLVAASGYAEARLRLLWMEGADVMRRGLVLAVFVLAAVSAALMTYFGLMVALVLWMARAWWDGDVLPGVILLAFFHLFIAAACTGWVIHAVRRTHFFHATLKELQEDRQWLNENQPSRN